MNKLLCALLASMLCGSLSLYAMDLTVPDTIDYAVFTFNVPKVKWFIEERGFDLNKTPAVQGFECFSPNAQCEYLLEQAIRFCRVSGRLGNILMVPCEPPKDKKALVEYLIPLTLHIKAFFKALVRLFAESTLDEEMSEIEKLFLEEAQRRDISLTQAFNRALFTAVQHPCLKQAINLLNSGADRAARSYRSTIFAHLTLRREKGNLSVEEEESIKDFLRTYAPDLKTMVALHILHQVREGTLSSKALQEGLMNLDALLLIADLARLDKDVESKWIALGMPYFEKARELQIKHDEKLVDILEVPSLKRAQVVNVQCLQGGL